MGCLPLPAGQLQLRRRLGEQAPADQGDLSVLVVQHGHAAVLQHGGLGRVSTAVHSHPLRGGILHLSRPQLRLIRPLGQGELPCPRHQLYPAVPVLRREEVHSVHLALLLLGLEGAQGGQAQTGGTDEKAPVSGGTLLRRPQGVPQLLHTQGEQPAAVQGPPGKLALIEHLAGLIGESAVALGPALAPLPFVVGLPLLAPGGHPLGLPSLERAGQVLLRGKGEGARTAVQPLGKAAGVDHGALLVIGGAGALIGSLGKLPLIGGLAVGVIGHALPRGSAPLEGPLVDQYALLVALSLPFVHPVLELALVGHYPVGVLRAGARPDAQGKLAFVDHHAVQVLRPGARAQAVLELPLVAEQSRLVILLPLALEHAVLQPSGVLGNGLFLISVDHHPPVPAIHPAVLHIKVGREEMGEDEGPDHEPDQQPQNKQPQNHLEDQGLGDEQPLGLHIVLPLGGVFGHRYRGLHSRVGRLGRPPGDIGHPAERRDDPGAPAHEEGADGAAEDAQGADQLCEKIVEHLKYLPNPPAQKGSRPLRHTPAARRRRASTMSTPSKALRRRAFLYSGGTR